MDSDLQQLQQRAKDCCELCKADNQLTVYQVPSSPGSDSDQQLLLCETCQRLLGGQPEGDSRHWRCLADSMWSQVPAVQVVAWRVLQKLAQLGESWAQALHETLYLDEQTLAWAQADQTAGNDDGVDLPVHLDSNGVVLANGDNVTLTKDLNVKGAGFTAKRGTAVRGISLVVDNPDQIEGRVEGQRIVILTQFVKKN